MTWIAISAFAVATVAAVRSTWSPCGVSMLSTLTPMSERAKGNSYPTTFTWFLIGSLLGGLTMGTFAALGAWTLGPLEDRTQVSAIAVILLVLVTIAAELKLAGIKLPTNPRQVDRTWLDRYRGWVYGLGFGWQLGLGVATYIMTTGVFLMVGLAILTGDPLLALALPVWFGLVRGVSILMASRVHTHAQLAHLHRTLESWRPASRVVAVLSQIAVLAVAMAAVVGPIAGIAVAVSGATAVVYLRSRLSDPTPKPRPSPGSLSASPAELFTP